MPVAELVLLQVTSNPFLATQAFESTLMPLVTIKLARRDNPITREQKVALIAGVTQLLQDTLAKRRDDVVVIIEEIDPDNWGQGGQTATTLRQARKRSHS